jgi:hypothetical protein
MGKASQPVSIAVRRHGFREKVISRLTFAPGPPVAGWVNYRNKVYPVFRDQGGKLFLNQDGWVASRVYPLRTDRDANRPRPDDGFDF